MTKRYFTFDEVNQLIPQLEYHFQKLLAHKKDLAKSSIELKSRGAHPQLFGDLPADLSSEVCQLQHEIQKHYREFKYHVFAIGNLGGEIKDLELGRVEFSAKHDEEESVLTWQLGVTELPHLEAVGEEDAVKASTSEEICQISISCN